MAFNFEEFDQRCAALLPGEMLPERATADVPRMPSVLNGAAVIANATEPHPALAAFDECLADIDQVLSEGITGAGHLALEAAYATPSCSPEASLTALATIDTVLAEYIPPLAAAS